MVKRIRKEVLMNQFDEAKQLGSDFVYVVVIAEGTKEVILIPSESFEQKKRFYKRSYTNEMVHVMNKDVKIVDCGSMKSDVLDFIFK